MQSWLMKKETKRIKEVSGDKEDATLIMLDVNEKESEPSINATHECRWQVTANVSHPW